MTPDQLPLLTVAILVVAFLYSSVGHAGASGYIAVVAASLLSVGCQKKNAGNETRSFRIIATDAGFQAPDNMPAGLRHVVR